MPTVLDARVVTGAGGGPDKTILNSPRFLIRAGYRMLCAYMHPAEDKGFESLRGRAAVWQAPLLSVHDRGPWDWRVITQLLRICREEQVRIWHAHDYKSNALGLLLRRFWPMRLVTTVHGWVKHTRRTPFYYAIDRLCLPHYERVLCVSGDLQARCLAARVPVARCLLLENAIDLDEYKRSHTIAQAKLAFGCPSDYLLVGAVGRLSDEKGFDRLIRSVHELRNSGLKVKLWIVGEGDQREPLQNLIAALGCGEDIRLLGYRSDVRELYEALDVFALSSLREGLPNVLLEAMALEVPVVATRVAGVPQLIRDGENGLLVAPNDVPALAQILRQLLTNADLRNRLGALGRRVVESRYSFAERMQTIGQIYDSLLARN
jgi:glycosyltransferase involved in cell wall biosynthesis